MTTTISILLFLIFGFLSSIHFYWGFGGKWGSDAVIPTKDDHVKAMKPGAIPTFIVAFGLLGFGLFILINSEIIHFTLPTWLNRYGLWIIFGIFFIRSIGDFKYVGFFKSIKHTKFALNDTRYFSPLCLLISLLTVLLELTK